MTPDPEYLTLTEAAVILRISRATAYKLAPLGEIPGVIRVGNQYRVRRAALQPAKEDA